MNNQSINHKNFLDEVELRDRLHLYTKNLNINKWDLGASSSIDSSVQVDKGEAKQMKSAQRNSITIRVWNESGLVGITSTSDLTDNGLLKAIEGAKDASNLGNPNYIPDFSPLSKEALPELKRPIINPLGIKSLFSILKEAEANLIAKHNSIKSVPYNGIAEGISERIYINSNGALRQMKSTHASLYLYARAEETGRKPRSSGAVRLAHGAKDIDIESCIDEASEKTIAHLNYQPIDTGR